MKIIFLSQLYQRIVVGSDGNVLLCANDEDDILLVTQFQSIHEIWHGSKMNELENYIQKRWFQKYLYAKTVIILESYTRRNCQVDENTIHNYVNRAQEVANNL